MKELTIRRLKHHSISKEYNSFLTVYEKLFLEDELSKPEKEKILSLSILFLNQEEEAMKRLGYRIVLAYGIKTQDFTPLYDVAVNSGLMPVASLIQAIRELNAGNEYVEKDSFLFTIVDSYIDNFRDQNLVLTEQQLQLKNFFEDEIDKTVVVVAPTSYGKSELIVTAIEKSPGQGICILVPSKSLLAQTKINVLNARIDWVQRIVSHPEMHRPDYPGSIHILTQERLTRILNSDAELSFDIVIVDEAHNLLSGDHRNILLASVLKTLDFRNPNTAFKFMTPFVSDVSNLKLKSTSYTSESFQVDEYIKSENIYIADYRESPFRLQYYDHFVHEFIELQNDYEDRLSYIHGYSADKNIIYFNRPKHVQEFALDLANSLPDINSDFIVEANRDIGELFHKQYLLLHCMKKGVLYHHGSMTDTIRIYTEYLYKNCPEIKYLVSTSTLLEGVNLPIEKMFIMSTAKGGGNLSASQFQNLIGRVSRLGEVFDNPALESVSKLQPEIHIIGSIEYMRSGANLETFVEKVMRVTKKIEDKVENVLLENVELNDKNTDSYHQAMTRLENIESGIAEGIDCPRVTTLVGLKLLEGDMSEIDIFRGEERIQEILDVFSNTHGQIKDSNTLMDLIFRAFVSFIDANDSVGKTSLQRLENDKAQTFYAMFLDWNVENAPYPVMIQRFVRYWEGLPAETPVFVGSWGETTKGDGRLPSFVYIKEKGISEKINLAIVRIKEEQDFVDYVIFRFIEILNELGLLEENYYLLIKYGTLDPKVIVLIMNGFSRGIAELLIAEYAEFLGFEEGDIVRVDSAIFQELDLSDMSMLQRLEINLNVAT